ncbi:BON domain-containing protein [Vibrio maerlii]|uniref:BON domain-containing protein n=1 Tax=Vibrio maerlii TaxID=2231648 RepID=UPI000E3CF18C|nr:BON domain-containing protein [Vibrio maerlii]
MKRFFRLALLSCSAALLSGCAGLFVAGAATTVTIVTDDRSTSEIWSDNNIEFEVAGLGNKQPFRGQARVVANAYRGEVVLMGQASTQELSNEFEQQTTTVKGVNVVHNQLRIKQPISLTRQSEDSWITTKIKSSLIANSELKDIKIKVITEDGEVFLFGVVTPEVADKATEIARNTSGVKQVIKAFQYPSE